MWSLVLILLAVWSVAWATGFAGLGALVHVVLAIAIVIALSALLRASSPISGRW